MNRERIVHESEMISCVVCETFLCKNLVWYWATLTGNSSCKLHFGILFLPFNVSNNGHPTWLKFASWKSRTPNYISTNFVTPKKKLKNL